MAQNIPDITADGLKYNIKRLQNTGFLKRIGPDFGGYWEVTDDSEEDQLNFHK